jgi:competence ComEA-like helix-hairpin-helix protein
MEPLSVSDAHRGDATGDSGSAGAREWLSGPPRLAAAAVIAAIIGVCGWRLLAGDTAHPGAHAGTAVTLSVIQTPPQATQRLAGQLDLNAASVAEFELLPGIGPSAAARIVAYREQIGGFHSVDELGGVKGIGTKTMERLRPLVRVVVRDGASSE